MMTIDKLESKVERMIEQIRAIAFEFHDTGLETDADEAKNEAIAALENYQELAAQDWEERPQKENPSVDDEDST
jgi:hypothetical protein